MFRVKLLQAAVWLSMAGTLCASSPLGWVCFVYKCGCHGKNVLSSWKCLTHMLQVEKPGWEAVKSGFLTSVRSGWDRETDNRDRRKRVGTSLLVFCFQGNSLICHVRETCMLQRTSCQVQGWLIVQLTFNCLAMILHWRHSHVDILLLITTVWKLIIAVAVWDCSYAIVDIYYFWKQCDFICKYLRDHLTQWDTHLTFTVEIRMPKKLCIVQVLWVFTSYFKVPPFRLLYIYLNLAEFVYPPHTLRQVIPASAFAHCSGLTDDDLVNKFTSMIVFCSGDEALQRTSFYRCSYYATYKTISSLISMITGSVGLSLLKLATCWVSHTEQ